MPKRTSSSDVSANNLEKTCGAGPRGPDANPAQPKTPPRTRIEDIPDDDVADYGLGQVSRRKSRRKDGR